MVYKYKGTKNIPLLQLLKQLSYIELTLRNAPDYDSNVLSTLVQTVEAFARVTYQSIYLIDYYRQEFLYVSDNPLFLCGHTAKEVKELGYSFYLEHVPEDEQKMLIELNSS